jgi:integral membrane protein
MVRMTAVARTPSTVGRRIALVARAGAVEATTYLVLVAAVVWHALLGGPDASRPLGLTHGVVFLAYAATVLIARRRAGWDSQTTISLLVASVVPGAGFVVPRRVIGSSDPVVATTAAPRAAPGRAR